MMNLKLKYHTIHLDFSASVYLLVTRKWFKIFMEINMLMIILDCTVAMTALWCIMINKQTHLIYTRFLNTKIIYCN